MARRRWLRREHPSTPDRARSVGRRTTGGACALRETRSRVVRVLLGIGLTLVLACQASPSWAEDATETTRASRRAARAKASSASLKEATARLESKLDQVLANQRAILEKSAAVKEELRVIKIRASSRGALSQ